MSHLGGGDQRRGGSSAPRVWLWGSRMFPCLGCCHRRLLPSPGQSQDVPLAPCERASFARVSSPRRLRRSLADCSRRDPFALTGE